MIFSAGLLASVTTHISHWQAARESDSPRIVAPATTNQLTEAQPHIQDGLSPSLHARPHRCTLASTGHCTHCAITHLVIDQANTLLRDVKAALRAKAGAEWTVPSATPDLRAMDELPIARAKSGPVLSGAAALSLGLPELKVLPLSRDSSRSGVTAPMSVPRVATAPDRAGVGDEYDTRNAVQPSFRPVVIVPDTTRTGVAVDDDESGPQADTPSDGTTPSSSDSDA